MPTEPDPKCAQCGCSISPLTVLRNARVGRPSRCKPCSGLARRGPRASSATSCQGCGKPATRRIAPELRASWRCQPCAGLARRGPRPTCLVCGKASTGSACAACYVAAGRSDGTIPDHLRPQVATYEALQAQYDAATPDARQALRGALDDAFYDLPPILRLLLQRAWKARDLALLGSAP